MGQFQVQFSQTDDLYEAAFCIKGPEGESSSIRMLDDGHVEIEFNDGHDNISHFAGNIRPADALTVAKEFIDGKFGLTESPEHGGTIPDGTSSALARINSASKAYNNLGFSDIPQYEYANEIPRSQQEAEELAERIENTSDQSTLDVKEPSPAVLLAPQA